MSRTQQQLSLSTLGRKVFATSLLLAAGMSAAATSSSAQEAIGVPFVGKNHLSFYTTELSRDGIGEARTALFGGAYGRMFGDPTGRARISMIVRAGARSLDAPAEGIVDAGATLAGTLRIPTLEALSLTASAGVAAIVWGQDANAEGVPGTGRVSARVPLGLGAAYDIRLGGATLAPFATLHAAYTRESDYVDDTRVALDTGWRLGSATGVSLRFKEMVLSIVDVNRERGMPNAHRQVFSVGMSW